MGRIDKRVVQKKESRKCARECFLRFLKSVTDELHTACVFAILNTRNPDKLPVLQELLGCNEDDMTQFLLLACLIRKGNESKCTTVLEAEWKSLANGGEFQFFEKEYYLRKSRKTKAYFISIGGSQQMEYHVSNEQFELSAVLRYQDIFQKDVKEFISQNEQRTSPASSSSYSQEKCCTTRKAFAELQNWNFQQEKRQNNNPTPVKYKKKHNDASVFHPYTSNFDPYEKENNHTMESYMPFEVIANAKNLSNSVDASVSLSGGLLLFCIFL